MLFISVIVIYPSHSVSIHIKILKLLFSSILHSNIITIFIHLSHHFYTFNNANKINQECELTKLFDFWIKNIQKRVSTSSQQKKYLAYHASNDITRWIMKKPSPRINDYNTWKQFLVLDFQSEILISHVMPSNH